MQRAVSLIPSDDWRGNLVFPDAVTRVPPKAESFKDFNFAPRANYRSGDYPEEIFVELMRECLPNLAIGAENKIFQKLSDLNPIGFFDRKHLKQQINQLQEWDLSPSSSGLQILQLFSLAHWQGMASDFSLIVPESARNHIGSGFGGATLDWTNRAAHTAARFQYFHGYDLPMETRSLRLEFSSELFVGDEVRIYARHRQVQNSSGMKQSDNSLALDLSVVGYRVSGFARAQVNILEVAKGQVILEPAKIENTRANCLVAIPDLTALSQTAPEKNELLELDLCGCWNDQLRGREARILAVADLLAYVVARNTLGGNANEQPILTRALNVHFNQSNRYDGSVDCNHQMHPAHEKSNMIIQPITLVLSIENHSIAQVEGEMVKLMVM